MDDGKSSISSVFREVTVTEARVMLTILGASGVWQACRHLGTDYEKLVMQAVFAKPTVKLAFFPPWGRAGALFSLFCRCIGYM